MTEEKKHEFTDEEGRKWSVRITHDAMRHVREKTGFAFGTSLVDGSFLDMLNDYELLGTVAFELISEQAKGRDISRQTFLSGFHGDTFSRAAESIAGAFAFFCPSDDRKMIDAFLSSNSEMKATKAELIKSMMIAKDLTSGSKDNASEPYSGSIPDL